MKCVGTVFVSVLLAMLAAWALAGCGESDAGKSGKPTVVATIFSYYDALRAIGGDKINAVILLPRGQTPHDYQTTFDDKQKVARAKLVIKNGLGIDNFVDKLAADSGVKVLDISTVVDKKQILKNEDIELEHAGGQEGREERIAENPHVWLDPMIQIAAAEKIRDGLIEIDPADKDAFAANAEKYINEIKALDAEYRKAVGEFKTREFIGFHSAYAYLAHRYGLRQVASIEEIPGSGVSLENAKKIIKLIQDNHIKYIAKETALNEKGAELIVRETGVKTITLQPLETYDDEKDTYVKLMRQNLEALKTALGG